MGDKKSIGIVTDPSKTFKITSKNRVFQFQYDQLPEDFNNKKQSFSDFLGGNFLEINTLVQELSSQGNVSVVLYVGKNLFIPENSRISPYELSHSKTIGVHLDLENWVNEKDILIISLPTGKLKEFLDSHGNKIVRTNKPCVVSTGKKMITELTKQLPENFTFVERKGVARFGYDNRQKILALLRGIS